MNYKAAEDLLELVNMYFKEKTLYLTKREANTLSIVKSIENVKEIDIKEGDTRKLGEAY